MGKDDYRAGAGTSGAVAESTREESAVSDLAPDAAGERDSKGSPSGGSVAPVRAARSGGGIKIYKPSQGYYTRIGTAIGATVLIVAGTGWWYSQLTDWLRSDSSAYNPLRYGISTAFLVLMGAVTYWVVGVNRRANEFFIATEGEMKKVNWSTRKDVVRSTKVVVAAVVLLAALLFLVDLLFMTFFSSIGVLQAAPGLTKIFGGGE